MYGMCDTCTVILHQLFRKKGQVTGSEWENKEEVGKSEKACVGEKNVEGRGSQKEEAQRETRTERFSSCILVHPVSQPCIGGVFNRFDFSPVAENRLSALRSHSHHPGLSTGSFPHWCTYQSIPCTESVGQEKGSLFQGVYTTCTTLQVFGIVKNNSGELREALFEKASHEHFSCCTEHTCENKWKECTCKIPIRLRKLRLKMSLSQYGQWRTWVDFKAPGIRDVLAVHSTCSKPPLTPPQMLPS